MRTKNDKPVLFYPRPSSPVNPPPGIQWGGAPWSSGKESRGNRLEIGSLWRVFAYFLHVEKVGRRRRRDRKTNRRGERRMRRGPMDCPLRRGRGQDGSVSPAGDPISFSGKEMGERNRQREPRRSTRRSLHFRRTVILRKLRIARWLLLFKSKHIVSI